jgi:hypothetical protein
MLKYNIYYKIMDDINALRDKVNSIFDDYENRAKTMQRDMGNDFFDVKIQNHDLFTWLDRTKREILKKIDTHEARINRNVKDANSETDKLLKEADGYTSNLLRRDSGFF